MKIRVKEIIEGCMPVRVNGANSDMFDLILGEDVTLKKGETYVARLGVAMELPKGMIGVIISRSSTPVKLGVMIANSVGLIDQTYNGDSDEWKAPLQALRATTIPKGTRICQFAIVPSQFSTFWQKLRWVLSKKLLLEKVDMLGNKDRGGIGSSGLK